MSCKNTLASKTHSFNPGQRFIIILSLLVIVSFTTLSYADFAFAQTEDQANNTKNTPELERMTFRVVFNGNDCTISEKFDVIPLSKCEMIKDHLRPHMTISVLPRQVVELMLQMDSDMLPSSVDNPRIFTSVFYELLDYQIQKNNVISERALGNDNVKDVEDKLVRVILTMEKGQCDFPKELNVKLIDTDCKSRYSQYPNQIAVDVPVSKLLELEKLDYVKKIDSQYVHEGIRVVLDVIIEPSTNNIEQEKTKSSTSNNPIEPTTIESDSDYTPYILILIILPVSVAITLFWGLRKKVKIEA